MIPKSRYRANHCKQCEPHKLRATEFPVQYYAERARARAARYSGRPVDAAVTAPLTPGVSDSAKFCHGGAQSPAGSASLGVPVDLYSRSSSTPSEPDGKRRRLFEPQGELKFDLNTLSNWVLAGKGTRRPPPSRVRNVVAVMGSPTPGDLAELADLPAVSDPLHQYAATTHMLVGLLHEKGMLQRCYTASMEDAVRSLGVPAMRVVPLTDCNRLSACSEPGCSATYSTEEFRRIDCCKRCGGVVRPGFFEVLEQDLSCCDLLMFIGVNLTVAPLPTIFNNAMLNPRAVRLVMSPATNGLKSDRNFEVVGNCQLECAKLVAKFGWKKEMCSLMTRYIAQLRSQGIPVPLHSDPEHRISDTVMVNIDGGWAQGIVQDIVELSLAHYYYRIAVTTGVKREIYISSKNVHTPKRGLLSQSIGALAQAQQNALPYVLAQQAGQPQAQIQAMPQQIPQQLLQAMPQQMAQQMGQPMSQQMAQQMAQQIRQIQQQMQMIGNLQSQVEFGARMSIDFLLK
eukprot:m51a1_g811 hypothetical protein (512) ;mRNA; f:680964-683611